MRTIVSTNTSATLLNRIQCLIDTNSLYEDAIDELIEMRLDCCSPGPSSSSSSGQSVEPDCPFLGEYVSVVGNLAKDGDPPDYVNIQLNQVSLTGSEGMFGYYTDGPEIYKLFCPRAPGSTWPLNQNQYRLTLNDDAIGWRSEWIGGVQYYPENNSAFVCSPSGFRSTGNPIPPTGQAYYSGTVGVDASIKFYVYYENAPYIVSVGLKTVEGAFPGGVFDSIKTFQKVSGRSWEWGDTSLPVHADYTWEYTHSNGDVYVIGPRTANVKLSWALGKMVGGVPPLMPVSHAYEVAVAPFAVFYDEDNYEYKLMSIMTNTGSYVSPWP